VPHTGDERAPKARDGVANARHLALIRKTLKTGDSRAWNEWRGSKSRVDPTHGYVSLIKVDLSNADLSGQWGFGGLDLADVNFQDARLRQAVFHGGNLRRANLRGADLTGADLRRAVLDGADLSGARLQGAKLGSASLTDVDLRGANLHGANLIGARFQATNLEGANLSDCLIYGVSAWDVRLDNAIQSNLVITRPEEPSVAVDDLEVAQFIHLLLNYRNLRNVLDSVTKRGVLLLGRFGEGGLDTLHAMGERLRQAGYLPIIFDFVRPRDRSYTETVQTLAGLARFVVVDLSGTSVPQELYATVPHLKIPFVPILNIGKRPHSMFVDLLEYEWVLRPIVEFANIDDLVEKVPDKIVAPAEKRIAKRQALLMELFGQ
jgi:uncharacterized protein YjbI with pentapeptide repeats